MLVEPTHPQLSVRQQCALLSVNRAGYYYEPVVPNAATLVLMRRIDELHTKHPYYGEPRITAQLKREGIAVNHKRIERLMRVMGITAIVPKKNLSQRNDAHAVHPYLLGNYTAAEPNDVWGVDITYIPLKQGWAYLVALLDWYSRFVLAWEVSPSLHDDFCVAAVKRAIRTHGAPNIHNSDQGSQFTGTDYLDVLTANGIAISMDHRGRCFDNIFTERLWRTVKYEEVYVQEYDNIHHATRSLNRYLTTYNHERIHQSLNYHTPAEVYQHQVTLD